MLILTADQVQYCDVVHQVEGESETLPGLAYRDKLFVKTKSFTKDNRKQAIQQCRHDFAQQEGRILFLVVEELTGFTLWREDDRVKRSTINLEQLVAQMRNVGGVKIKDRRYNLRVYSRCFVGSEAVSWLMDNLQLSQTEAVALGQRLINEKWIHHVTDDHPFKNDDLFYRFYWDE